MTTSATITCSTAYGDSKKPWIARIVGTDPKYGFAREFLAVRQDGRNGSTVVTEDGLFECSSDGKRSKDPTTSRFCVVRNGEELPCTDEIATLILAHIAAGGTLDSLVRLEGPVTDGGTRWRNADGTLRTKDRRATLTARRAALLTELAAIEEELSGL